MMKLVEWPVVDSVPETGNRERVKLSATVKKRDRIKAMDLADLGTRKKFWPKGKSAC